MKRIAAFFITLAFLASMGIVFDAPASGQWIGTSQPEPVEEEFVPETKDEMKDAIKKLKEELKGLSKEEKEAKKAELKESSQYWKMVIKELEKEEKK